MTSLAPVTPESLYTLQVRDSTQDSSPDSSWFDLQQADGRSGPIGTSWMNQSMAGGELADVYVLSATLRQPLRLTLRRREADPGPVQRLAFELFAPSDIPAVQRGLGLGSFTKSSDIETLTVAATRSGPYLAVVYRTDGSNAGTPLTYDFETSSATTLDAPPVGLPRELSFAGATPNPARGATELAFALPASGRVRLEIYDAGGRRVRVLAAGEQPAGEHHVRWGGTTDDHSPAHAGLYFARLSFAGRTLVRRLILLP